MAARTAAAPSANRVSVKDDVDRKLLLSCVSGLGCRLEEADTGRIAYVKTDDCVECLKDIQRFLRNDDSLQRPAFFELQRLKIAEADLVPLLQHYPGDDGVVLNAVKVATFITMPIDPQSAQQVKQVEQMQLVKEAFLKQGALMTAATVGLEPLQNISRITEQGAQAVQLIFAFFRNLLSVPDRDTDPKAGYSPLGLTTKLLDVLFKEDITPLLLCISQQMGQVRLRSYAPLVLEVFSRIFHGLDANQLLDANLKESAAKSSAQANQPSQPTTSGALGPPAAAAAAAAAVKTAGKPVRPRRARFGAVFCSNLDPERPSTSRVLRNAPTKVELPALECEKPKTKHRHADEARSRPGQELLLKLQGLLEDFLSCGYGPLMEVVRKQLEPGLSLSRLSPSDFLRFVQLARLCTSYVHQKEVRALKAKSKATKENVEVPMRGADPAAASAASPFAAISATMGWDTLHLVQSLWLSTIDLPPSSKEKNWELQHTSLCLLKEMLLALDVAYQAGTPNDSRAAKRLLYKLLHDDQRESGLLPVLSRMLKKFSFRHQPASHAAEIVESIHVTIRLLERLSKAEDGGFIVKRKLAARKRKAAPRSQPSPQQQQEGSAPGQPEAGAGTAGAAAGREPETADAAAPEPGAVEADPVEPEAGKAPEANGSEGQPGGIVDENSPRREAEADPAGNEGKQHSRADPFEELEEEEEEQQRVSRTKEVSYNLNQRVRQELAHPGAVHIYSWLLRGYLKNTDLLNHSIAVFFYRISSEKALNLEPMLYQVSVLRVFQQILADTEFRKHQRSEELVGLGTKLTRNLFARLIATDDSGQPQPAAGASTEGASRPPLRQGSHEGQEGEAPPAQQPLSERAQKETKVKANLRSALFVEMLFWKNQPEAEQLREEHHWRLEQMIVGMQYIYHERGHSPAASGPSSPVHHVQPGSMVMTSAQEVRLLDLFEEYGMQKGHLDLIADKFEEGWSRARIAKGLKNIGLKRGVLTHGQKEQLQQLYEEHRKQKGYQQLIADGMRGAFRKSQIARHISKLGLRKKQQQRGGSLSGSESGSAAAGASSDSEPGSGNEGDARDTAPADARLKLKRRRAQSKQKRNRADWSESESDDGAAQADKVPSSRAATPSHGHSKSQSPNGSPEEAREGPKSPSSQPRQDNRPIQSASHQESDREEGPVPEDAGVSQQGSEQAGIEDNRAEITIVASRAHASEQQQQPSINDGEQMESDVQPKRRRRLEKKADAMQIDMDSLWDD